MFRLAVALGKTVRELERELSSSELSEWMAYYRLEPFDRDTLSGMFGSAKKEKTAKQTRAEVEGILRGLKESQTNG